MWQPRWPWGLCGTGLCAFPGTKATGPDSACLGGGAVDSLHIPHVHSLACCGTLPRAVPRAARLFPPLVTNRICMPPTPQPGSSGPAESPPTSWGPAGPHSWCLGGRSGPTPAPGLQTEASRPEARPWCPEEGLPRGLQFCNKGPCPCWGHGWVCIG